MTTREPEHKVYLREVDAGTDNACLVVCAKNDPGAVLFTADKELRAEVERLHSENAIIRRQKEGDIRRLAIECGKANDEVERLKAEFMKIVTLDGHAHMYRRIAREAVEHKP